MALLKTRGNKFISSAATLPAPLQQFLYLDIITAFFVAVLLISNIASTKIIQFWIFTFDAGTLLFPLSYIFGDILTEVYGYARSRRVIWIGFVCAVLMTLTMALVQYLPAASDWPYQDAFTSVLGVLPRIVIASIIAYLAGEFTNSAILAKMKVWMNGKHLWVRTIGSTLIGQLFDTAIFCVIAFFGVFSSSVLWSIILSNYIFKILVEVLFTPITYWIVGFLKKKEGVDVYDRKTNFNPFRMNVK